SDSALLQFDAGASRPRVLKVPEFYYGTNFATVGERLFAVNNLLLMEWDPVAADFVPASGAPRVIAIASGSDRLLIRLTAYFILYDPESDAVTDTNILTPTRGGSAFAVLADGSFVSIDGNVVMSGFGGDQLLAAVPGAAFHPAEDGALIWPAWGTHGPGALFRT